MTYVVRLLLFANVAVYFLQEFARDRLYREFALWPLGSHYFPGLGRVAFEPWQLLTSGFLHGSFAHIALNMYGLFMFGSMVERAMGARRFALLYFASVLTGSLVQLLVVTMALDQGVAPTIGASGGVFGVMLAFAALFPHSRVMLVFPPIPMKAWVLVAGFAAIELMAGVFGTNQGVAHFAHLGGMLGAIIVLLATGFRWGRQSGGDVRGP
jgi:membrane associated rhomboid family serine protease